VYIKPPLERVGLMQWDRMESIVQQGYEHAKEVLARQGAT
jgi:NTE family protein